MRISTSRPFEDDTLGMQLRARSGQRGAALFVVLLAILLLSGLGMWASFAAGNLARAAGYARAAAQTRFVAEMGVLSTAGYLNLPGMANTHYNLALQAPESCLSVPANSICRSVRISDIEDVALDGVSLLDESAAGSFGPLGGKVEGDFIVELTSPVDALVAGAGINQSNSAQMNSPYKSVTLTSYGMIRPQPAGTTAGNICANTDGVSSTAENSTAGRVAVRAQAIIGPVN